MRRSLLCLSNSLIRIKDDVFEIRLPFSAVFKDVREK